MDYYDEHRPLKKNQRIKLTCITIGAVIALISIIGILYALLVDICINAFNVPFLCY